MVFSVQQRLDQRLDPFRNRPPARGAIVPARSYRCLARNSPTCQPERQHRHRCRIQLGTISEDPIGFDAGDSNLRRYVGNSSTFAVDPSGLEHDYIGPAPDHLNAPTLPYRDDWWHKRYVGASEADELAAKGQISESQAYQITHAGGGRAAVFPHGFSEWQWAKFKMKLYEISPLGPLTRVLAGLFVQEAYVESRFREEGIAGGTKAMASAAVPHLADSIALSGGKRYVDSSAAGIRKDIDFSALMTVLEVMPLAKFGGRTVRLADDGIPWLQRTPTTQFANDVVEPFSIANGTLQFTDEASAGITRLHASGGTGRFHPIGDFGSRNSVPLTPAQRSEAVGYARSLGIPDEAISVTDNLNTGYKRLFGQERLYIGPDVLPGTGSGLSANARVSMRGALAHELVGHRAAELAGRTQATDFLEEAQASIRAARFAPDLGSTERYTLLRDGISRLRQNNIRIGDVKDLLWIQP